MEAGSIIGKAIVSIEYNGRTDGLVLQEAVNNWWDKLLMPEIEAMVHDMEDDILVRIQSIACDITIKASEDWQQAARRQVLSKLEEEISSRKNNLLQADTSGILKRRSDEAQRKTSSQRFVEEWLFYLQMGFMPWWSEEKKAQEWTAAINDYIEHTATAADIKPLAAYVTMPAVSGRLIAQLQGPVFWKFMQLFSAWEPAYINDIRNREQALINKMDNNAAGKNMVSSFRKNLVTAAAHNYSQKETLLLLKETIAPYTASGAVTAEELFRNLSPGDADGQQDIGGNENKAGTDVFRKNEQGAEWKNKTSKHIAAQETGAANAPGSEMNKEKDSKARTAEDLFAGIDAVINALPSEQDTTEENSKSKTAEELFTGANDTSIEGTTASQTTAPDASAENPDARTAEELFAGIDAEAKKTGDLISTDNESTDTQNTLQEPGKVTKPVSEETAGIKENRKDDNRPENITGDDKPGHGKNAEELWHESLEKSAGSSDSDAGVKTENEAPAGRKNVAASASEQAKRAILKEEMHEAAKEGIYIQNAGMVIFAVYLGTFFRNLELVKDDTITDMPRAMALLHYMATGSAEFAEFEIVLPKILCGIEPDEFVDTSYILTENDKEEAEQLLEAVIENWPALKNTSTESLRGTFLTREGKLTYSDGSWRLHVHEKSFDILVDMLPWNISMIYMPWMLSVLHVSWRNS